MNVVMLGSRIYQPLTDVDTAVAALPETASVTAIGSSDVALRAESAGTARGLVTVRRPLETTRRTLLELAAQPNTNIVLFVARDPETRQPTEGMAGIQALLIDRGFTFSLVSSELPGKVCQLISELRTQTAKALATVQGRRQLVIAERALKVASAVVDERDRYEQKLEEGMPFRVGDPELDAKWISWERTYRALCDALTEAKALLTLKAAA